MDISTLELLALMASGVAIIVGLTFAMTSKSRLVKAAGYAFTAALIAAVAAAVFLTPTQDADAARARNIAGLLLLAAAGWLGYNAIRAHRGR
jgi:hypothetical protein